MSIDIYIVIGRDGRYLAIGSQSWTMTPRKARRFRSREQAQTQADRFYGARVERAEDANE